MKINEITEHIELDQFLLEMANLTKRMTGLPVNIYISSKDSVHDRHGPRIKVMTTPNDSFNKDTLTSVSISSTPKDFFKRLNNKDFKQVSQFIIQNEKALLAFWNNELDVGQLLNVLEG